MLILLLGCGLRNLILRNDTLLRYAYYLMLVLLGSPGHPLHLHRKWAVPLSPRSLGQSKL